MKIVLARRDGLMQIAGDSFLQPPSAMVVEHDTKEAYNLVAAKRGYWLYRPLLEPQMQAGKGFDKGQR